VKKIVFVCLGNICRSPVAEGLLKTKIRQKGLTDQFYADSAGTSSYQLGNPPHETSAKIAKQNGVMLNHFAKQFTSNDFSRYDYIICMDDKNYSNVIDLAKSDNDKEKVYLMRQWEAGPTLDSLESAGPVPDPYGGPIDGFIRVHQLLDECTDNLMEYLIKTETQPQ